MTDTTVEPQFQPVPKPEDFQVPDEITPPADTPVPAEVQQAEADALELPPVIVNGLPVVVQHEIKSGFKTSEFVVGTIISLLTLIGTIPMPEHYKAYVIGGLGAAYAISRGLTKLGGKPTVVPPVPEA